jgi:hypothetical protein
MERQRTVRESLRDMQEFPVALDRLGSRVVLNAQRGIGADGEIAHATQVATA